MFHHRCRRGAAGQARGEIVAEPEDRVVPPFTSLRQRQMGEIGMLFEQETPDQVGVDGDFGRRLNKSQMGGLSCPVA